MREFCGYVAGGTWLSFYQVFINRPLSGTVWFWPCLFCAVAIAGVLYRAVVGYEKPSEPVPEKPETDPLVRRDTAPHPVARHTWP